MATSTTAAPHQHQPQQQKLLLLTPDPQRAAPRPLRHSVPTRLALTPIHAPTPVLASAPAFASASLSLSTPTLAGTPASPAWSPSPSSSGSGSLAASIPRKKSGEPLKSSLKSRRPLVRGSLSVLTALSTTTTTTNTPASSRAASPHPNSPGASDTGTGMGMGTGASTRSAPATPGLSAPKNVHFDAQLARVRLYFAGQRPLAVSRGGSPTADAGSGTESEGVGIGGRDEDDDDEEGEDESGDGKGEYRVEMRWVDGPGESGIGAGDEDTRDVVLESLELDCGDPATVDATHDELVAAGSRSHLAPWDAFWGQRYATVLDPDGNAVDLFAALAG